MYARIFFKQVNLGLKLYLRVPSAMFWMIAFPIVMLLGLGVVLGDKAHTGAKLVWMQTLPATANKLAMQQALLELGLTIEPLTPTVAEERWRQGKLPALLETQDGQYKLRVNSYLAAQAGQVSATVQQAFLMVQARALGATELIRIPVAMESPGGHHRGPYVAFLLPGLLGLNLLMMGSFRPGWRT
jgi:ABC-2 type transport system permease protein